MELHDSIKKNQKEEEKKVTKLSDVYYEPTKMIKWKDVCVKTYNNLKGKVEKLEG